MARDGGGGGETRHATCAEGSSRRTSSQGKFRGLSLPDSLGERGERLEERLRALALRARHREDASRDHDSDARGGLGATEKGDTHETIFGIKNTNLRLRARCRWTHERQTVLAVSLSAPLLP
jgi:hypothetical protein